MIDAPSTNWNSTKEFYICTYACIYNYIYIYIVYRNWPLRSQRNVFGIRINSTDQHRPAPPRPLSRSDCRRHPRIWPTSHLNCSRQEKHLANIFRPQKLPLFRLRHSKVWRFAVHVWCVISADRCVAPLWNAKSPAIHSIVLTGIFSFSLTISIWLHSWGKKMLAPAFIGVTNVGGLNCHFHEMAIWSSTHWAKKVKKLHIFFWNCFNFSVLKNR